MGTQCGIRARGRIPAPQRIGDPGRRYAPISIDQQQRKQLTLLAPTKLEPLPPVHPGGKRTQDAEPRLPSRRRCAEFHQVSLSAPVPHRIALRHGAVNILRIDVRTSTACYVLLAVGLYHEPPVFACFFDAAVL
jgi:hypothetical protein